jgi:predicted N-formylglutamate amidohydrolase
MHEDIPAFEIIPGDFSKGLLLVCDHASNHLPSRYGSLGLSAHEFKRHIAYDIGAGGLARGLSGTLGVPAVLSTYSRLLIDPNRGEDDPTLVRQIYDGTVIPGNYPLSADELHHRLETFHRPYHRTIETTLAQFEKAGVVPAVFSIHTMTDFWNGEKRPWQASILWDKDPRFAVAMLEMLRGVGDLAVGDNQPYDGALRGDSMYRHGTKNGLAHALIEVRQDLVRDADGIAEWVRRLTPLVEKANADPHNHQRQFFGTRTDVFPDGWQPERGRLES